jgi:hypothetical protein
MKKWLFITLLCLVPLSLAWAEPFLATRGAIMEADPLEMSIVVNEKQVFVDQSTSITSGGGLDLDFSELRPGRFVFVEAEPDDDSRLVAEKIVLLRR